jgi:nucleoside-diphosphate-sugar epimerase
MIDNKQILVTGATGFIGGRIIETLYLKGHQKFQACMRSWNTAARISRFPIDTVVCDVLDPKQTKCAMGGVDVVIHCAVGNRDVNIVGTKNLLEAALDAGIDRFVYLSTAEVYGNVQGEISETQPYKYSGNEYCDSKIEAEKLCWDYHKKGLAVVIIRPTIVYGPFSTTWTIEMAEKLQSGKWIIYNKYCNGICNLVYIDDIVSGILLSAEREEAIGNAFNINGSERISWNQYFSLFAEVIGVEPIEELNLFRSRIKTTTVEMTRKSLGYLKRNLQKPMERLPRLYKATKKIIKPTNDTLKLMPTQYELSLYSREAYYDTSKARDLLGYETGYDVRSGLKMCALWLRHHEYVH